jgi:SAM-dependent methyltransferase
MGEEQVRARVFGAVADEYQRIRPGYPDRLFDDVLAYEAGARGRALEVGAGTGKATLAFADRGVRITALEPDPEMAAVLSRRTAGRPEVTVRVASFEDGAPLTDPPPQRYGLLYSAQAWHWTDPATRWERAAATLRPGGALALFWNDDQLADPECATAVMAVHQRVAPDMDAAAGPVRRPEPPTPPEDGPVSADDEWPRSELLGRPEFGELTERQYRWSRHLSAADYAALLNTHSEYRILDPATRQRLLDALATTLPARVELAVSTVLYLARRA